jgi:hypothetical protein
MRTSRFCAGPSAPYRAGNGNCVRRHLQPRPAQDINAPTFIEDGTLAPEAIGKEVANTRPEIDEEDVEIEEKLEVDEENVETEELVESNLQLDPNNESIPEAFYRSTVEKNIPANVEPAQPSLASPPQPKSPESSPSPSHSQSSKAAQPEGIP